MTDAEILAAIAADSALQALRDAGNYAGIASALSGTAVTVETRMVTERAVRALDPAAVSPASRHALLQTLEDAQTTTPVWMTAVMTAAGISAADQPAYIADIKSAHRWLIQEGGIDVGSAGARSMLDLIAAGVPAAATACVAVKALAEVPDVVSVHQVSRAIIEGAE